MTDRPAGLEGMFEQSHVGMATLDAELRFVRVNPALARLNGHPVEAHVGRTVRELLGPAGETMQAAMRRALEGGVAEQGDMVSRADPGAVDGRRLFQANYTPIRARDGRVAGLGVVLIEVTERRRAEAERERLRRAAERAAARSQLRAEIGTALEATRGARARMRRLLDLLVPTFADFATIDIASADGDVELVAASHRDARLLDDLRALHERRRLDAHAPMGVARVLETGEARLMRDIPPAPAAEDARDADTSAPLQALAPRSLLGLPLAVRGRVFGALTLTRTEGRARFDADEFLFGQDLAARSSLSIENERLYEREHAVAVELQRSLLAGELPRDEHLDLAVAYRPTPDELALAGGDWHDAVARPDGRLGLIVGDVVGHGLAAATAMGQLRSAARALALTIEDPAALLHQLDAFATHTPGAAYATLVCVLLAPRTGELRYAAAGHPPALVVPPRAAAHYLLDGRSVPLAAGDGRARASARATLGRGATLLLYTDGLVERRGESLEAGLARLAETMTALRGQPIDLLSLRLAPGMLPDARQLDDIALLVARRRARPRPHVAADA